MRKDKKNWLKDNFSYPLLETEKNSIKLKFELEQKNSFKD